MDLLERAKEKIKQIKKEWVTPEEQSSAGGLTLRTPDGKTEVTVIITNPKDAYKAKQLVNLALRDTNIDYTEPYALGSLRMGE